MQFTGTAVFSPCERYRYVLTRTWDEQNPKRCMFILLNPSTATEEVNDPTIRRCMGFAKEWGYGSYYLGNLFAYRATNPRDMKVQEDPVGPDNIHHLLTMAIDTAIYGGDIICGWGMHGKYRGQDKNLLGLMGHYDISVKALKLTKDGMPCHPLYLKGDLKPMEFNMNPGGLSFEKSSLKPVKGD